MGAIPEAQLRFPRPTRLDGRDFGKERSTFAPKGAGSEAHRSVPRRSSADQIWASESVAALGIIGLGRIRIIVVTLVRVAGDTGREAVVGRLRVDVVVRDAHGLTIADQNFAPRTAHRAHGPSGTSDSGPLAESALTLGDEATDTCDMARTTAAVSYGRLIVHPGALVGYATSFVLIVIFGLWSGYSGLSSLAGAIWAMGWVGFVALFHHELAHAAAARVLGFEVPGWGIRPRGAYVLIGRPRRAVTWRAGCLVFLAGPMSNLASSIAFAVLYLRLGPSSGLAVRAFLRVVCAGEAFMCVYNLIPYGDHDGVRALQILRMRRLPPNLRPMHLARSRVSILRPYQPADEAADRRPFP
jgi:hypothetical protein